MLRSPLGARGRGRRRVSAQAYAIKKSLRSDHESPIVRLARGCTTAPCAQVSPVGTTVAVSTIRITLFSGARVQCMTPFRHDETLIGQKLDRATFKVDDEPSTQDEEELIVVVVFVPVVFALHHTKAHHRLVYPAEGLIVPWVRDGLGQHRDVDKLQGVELDIEMRCIRVGRFSHSVVALSSR